jgi:hypothetical protein
MKSALVAVIIVALLTFGVGSAVYAWYGGCRGAGYGHGWMMGPDYGVDQTVRPDNTADPRRYGQGRGGYGHWYGRGGRGAGYGSRHGWGNSRGW